MLGIKSLLICLITGILLAKIYAPSLNKRNIDTTTKKDSQAIVSTDKYSTSVDKVRLDNLFSQFDENTAKYSANLIGSVGNKAVNANKGISIPFSLGLTGTVLKENEASCAIFFDKNTLSQNYYRIGQSVRGVKILEINKDSVVVEYLGVIRKLDIGRFINEARTQPNFQVEKRRNDSVVIKHLPYFEPVINAEGPPIDPNVRYRPLPEFVPVKNNIGPLTSK